MINILNKKFNFLFLVFVLFVPILMGILGSMSSGISFTKFLPNFAGLLIGLVIILTIYKYKNFIERHCFKIATSLALLLTLTFISTGIENVFRWIRIGPLNLHLSAIFLPVIIYNCVNYFSTHITKALLPIFIASIVLVFQPDAAQMLGLFSSTIPLIFFKFKQRKILLGLVPLALLTIYVWFRPDTLEPISHVEGILKLIYLSSGFGVVLVCFSICTLFLPILFLQKRLALFQYSFLFYLLGCLLATLVGHFPVHVIGAGFSPVLGWCIGIALARTMVQEPS